MRRGLIAILGMLAVAAGCGKSQPTDKLSYVKDDDAQMNAAIEQARASVGKFVAALQSPGPAQSAFSVKLPVVDGDQVEHMWLSPVRYDGTKFEGVINNEPVDVKNVRIGQTLSVTPAQISDWMYIDNKHLVGGYTLRVLRDNASEAERAEFDKSFPATID